MDFALFAASFTLTVYLPRRISHGKPSKELSSVTIALCLSLCLFSLSVLEATPSTWLILLTNEDTAGPGSTTSGLVTITNAYRLVLWLLSLLLIFVFPGLVGTQILGRILQRAKSESTEDPDERKKRTFDAWRQNPWYIRFGYKLILLVFKIIHYILLAPCLLLLQTFYRTCRRRPNGPVLVMTNDDQRQSPKAGVALFIESTVYRRSVIFGTLLGVAATIGALGLIAPMVFHTTGDTPALSEAVSWLCAVGILLSALLNGFGSVSMPFSCLAGLFLQPIRTEAIVKAEVELQKAKASSEERRA
jgi:hypothetical protein